MNSHIINPFKVDTQFTLQIHLIIDLITFKEAMVFGSIGMQSWGVSPPLSTLTAFLQKLILQGLGDAWRCVTSVRNPHLIAGSVSPGITFQSPLGEGGEKSSMGYINWTPFAQTSLRETAPSIPAWSIPGAPVGLLRCRGLPEALTLSCTGGSHQPC